MLNSPSQNSRFKGALDSQTISDQVQLPPPLLAGIKDSIYSTNNVNQEKKRDYHSRQNNVSQLSTLPKSKSSAKKLNTKELSPG